MNYFITHCDEKYIKYAERLFESLQRYSSYKVLFFSIGFDYKNRFDNVISIRYDINKYLNDKENDLLTSLSGDEKCYHVFLKPLLAKNILRGLFKIVKPDDVFCYVDADCFVMKDCDLLFDKSKNIIDYPLLTVACQEYMMLAGRGSPFVHEGLDLSRTLEAPLMNLLGIDVNLRTPLYLQTGLFIFNYKCYDFILKWCSICFSKLIMNNVIHLAPFHEETVINCLLWEKKINKNLGRGLINVIEGDEQDLKKMVETIENPSDDITMLTSHCTVPSKSEINDLYFYHRRVNDKVYNFLMNNNKKYFLKVLSTSLGDTLAVTPTLRKLSNLYNSLINVVTHNKELFKNNPYVDKIIDFQQLENENLENSEIFETFLGIGEKNQLGVEKKHNTIDIRQFHAIDLGFSLLDEEMEYDYVADDYELIEDLPKDYIALHASSTWPSRTYSNEKWQEIIQLLNSHNIPVVLVGKNDYEKGFHEIHKNVLNLSFEKGLDLTNKLTLSQCWHVINKSKFFITMDSGLLHLAGTTNTYIIQLGSSINNKLRAPFRKKSQDYKYAYISGDCDIFCASNMKYGIKEWGTIQGVPPLIGCLEKKESFECHPKAKKVFDFINLLYLKNEKLNKKIIFLAPHLSTGGSPAYLKWLIEKRISEGYKVKVIEYCLYSDSYVVHRNQIKEIVGDSNFINFGSLQDSDEAYEEKTSSLINFIKNQNPSEIHLNEIAEDFSLKPLTAKLKEFLYSKDREFKIFETCHNSTFDFKNKVLIPDEFHFCSKFHLEASKNLDVPKKIIEMEIRNKKRPDRLDALKKVNLSPDYFHVLNVGLFMKNKNQKYLFDLAEKLQHKKIMFHFIGNTCFINDCGITEYQKKLPNCIVHGEKNNVDDYMAAMDLFAFPSLLELNPICLKEALSWGMKIFMNKLDVYYDYFDNNDLVTYLKDENLFNYLNSIEDFNFKQHIVDDNKILHHIDKGEAKIEILGDQFFDYNVKFFNSKNQLAFECSLSTNAWAIGYIDDDGKIELTNLTNGEIKNLYFKDYSVVNESGALGDCLAWAPIVNEFAINKNRVINYYTPHKHLFEDSEYPMINFKDYSEKHEIDDKQVKIDIGCFDKNKMSFPLQELVANILDVDIHLIKNKKPILNKKYIKEKPFDKKYVCIATHSTAQLKYWNNPDGWDQTVDYLKDLGYEVVCLDKHQFYGNDQKMNSIPRNSLHYPGDDMGDIINCLHHCEFMIGLSSGLSWLAWACGSPVIMICGFLKPEYHFETPYYVQNTGVCNNCWHNSQHIFDSSNWMWCPENKDFECSREISFNQVKENINQCISDLS